MKPIQIVHDSVVFQKTDAIVNAANTTLMGGDGVDGAIHDAAGDRLYWYFNDLGCTCQPGEAIESPGFNLPAKHIIHTVGPIWHEGKFNEPEILAECYRNCLDEAVKHDCRSISFCCISVGVYRYPLDAATRIALKATSDWLAKSDSEMLVRFCCYTDEEFATYRKVAEEFGLEVSLDCEPVCKSPERPLQPEDLNDDLCRFLRIFESLCRNVANILPEFMGTMLSSHPAHYLIREIEELEYKTKFLKYFLLQGIAGIPGGRIGWYPSMTKKVKLSSHEIRELKNEKSRCNSANPLSLTATQRKELYESVWRTRPLTRFEQAEQHDRLLREMRLTVYQELGISLEAQLVSAIFGDGKIVLVWDKDAEKFVCETQNTANRPTGSDIKAEDKGSPQ